MGNLIKLVFTLKPQDLMGDNGWQLHYFVLTQKYAFQRLPFLLIMNFPSITQKSLDPEKTLIYFLAQKL